MTDNPRTIFFRGTDENVYILQHFDRKKKNVYIWQHLISKKNPNVYIWHPFDPKNLRFVSPAAGCVKNVYILHHFDPPKKKQNCFGFRRAV